MEDKIFETVHKETNIPYQKIVNTVKLLDEGNTIPFIARYRKEVTGMLDEVQIRLVEERVKFHRNLEQRKNEVIRLIDEQGKLTDTLREQILKATKPLEIEDLYRPYRPKRKTRASVARDKGLEPLAEYLLSFPREGNPEEEASAYLTDKVNTVDEALQGARDIIAEKIADDPEVRKWIRNYTSNYGQLVTQGKDMEKDSVYRMYYNSEPIKKIVPHRILAINRGEKEGFLKVSIEIEIDRIINWLNNRFAKKNSATTGHVRTAIIDAYKRLILPAVEREIRNELTEKAEAQAVTVFSRNLRNLLLQRPIRGRSVLAIDPAYRTGCKWAVLDATGKLLETGVFYPTPPQSNIEEASKKLEHLIEKYNFKTIAIGNGTASRETEQFVANFIKENKYKQLEYTIINEAGASVYSASELAAKEFPDLDVSARSAISIGRRLQDPLAELVKIDPKSIGVGQYQHDVNQKQLDQSLTNVVESVVNYVGVNLNTASSTLLKYVAGINKSVAENIVQFREENGPFKNRNSLSKVPKLGPKTLKQCIGFLRILEGQNSLDATAIHPESYDLTMRLLELIDADLGDIGTETLRKKLEQLDIEKLSKQLDAGTPTLQDIIESLKRPGRDPREDLPPPIFRNDVLTLEDLKLGMQLQGTVRNVVDFGAFVDIGVKTDGLVHISQMSEHYLKHPLDKVSVGDIVEVKILSVDADRQKISLSMLI
ncbi:MAG: protein Tex [Clostridia bacterium]|nr:protein Tex [Clostridia bacterium]